MKKYPLPCYYAVDQLPEHVSMRQSLLDAIAQSPADKNYNISPGPDTGIDNVTKVDWHRAVDWTRPWAVQFGPVLQNHLNSMLQRLGYHRALIHQLWFQQYHRAGLHAWHIHGCNFTGVYYLELPENAPKTQIKVPYDNKIVEPEITEGSVLFFPSFTVHQAPLIQSDLQKTIISFNFDALMRD